MFTLIPVILAGGEGKRLWPLSSAESPKQFLGLGKDGKSLFSASYKRALMVAPSSNIIVVTRESFARQAWAEIKTIDKKSKATAILEPFGRNTAAAISMAAMHALSNFENPVLWVMPSDHYIEKPFSLINAVQESAEVANAGKVVTFGVLPDRINGNYGHIICGDEINRYHNLFGVKLFIEKPQGRRLEWFMRQNNCVWNSGMFMFSADTILKQIKTRNQAMVAYANRAYTSATQTKYGLLASGDAYENLPDLSIDKLVMENNENLVVRPVDMGWSDVGTWQSLWELSQKESIGGKPLEKFLQYTKSAA
jgi:mannose-1-phosphate guanylyltransferase/mannose-6-phosphate isomerase